MKNYSRDRLTIGCFLSEAAQADPDKPFLYFRDTQFSYAQFVAHVDRSARAFQDLKLGKGDKVCLLLPNGPEFLFAWFGLAQIGAITVFANTALKEPEIRYILHHSESKAIVTASRFLGLALNSNDDSSMALPPICADSPAPTGTLSFEEMLRAASPTFHAPELRCDDLATFIYTSGTTGMPKAVMQTHQTYVLTGQSIPVWLGLNSGDRLFTCLPLFHINAQAYSVMGSIGARASLVLGEKFSASNFWNWVKASRATECNLIGAMPLMLLKEPPSRADRDHSVRVVYTAPALSKMEHLQFEERFGVVLVAGYGMSECTFGTINSIDPSIRRLESNGLPRFHPDPRFGNEFRLIDDSGQEVPAGETGEIVMKNATLMKGYYKDPEATGATLRNGWLHTGDLAYQDNAGFVFFAGRKKDMIRLKGENVSAYEVERVINEFPGVLESAVVGLPSQLGDERIVAAVLRKPGSEGLSADDILGWCKTKLADFKIPSLVEFRDTLPKTPTQKIAKQILREELMRQDFGNQPLQRGNHHSNTKNGS